MNTIDILRKIIALNIAKTRLGENIHYIIESEDKLNSWANTALEHLIKIEIIKDNRYRSVWLNTIRKSFINIAKNSWIRSQDKNKIRKSLLNKLKDFEIIYSIARAEFNNNLIKNQSPFPKTFTHNQRMIIVVKWKLCIDKLLSDDLEFFNALDKHLE